MSIRGFLIEILLHIYHAVDRCNFWLFIYFYYSQIIRTFTRTCYCFIMHIQTSFLTIMMSRIQNDSSIHIPDCTKQPIQVLQNKNNIM